MIQDTKYDKYYESTKESTDNIKIVYQGREIVKTKQLIFCC